VCDGQGNPVLECMCGNVLRGRFNPAKPFFTARGSFWSNCTTELLASTTEADRQARTRNRCNGQGYESVALIPIRTGTTVHGLLQFNDRRKGRFTPHAIALLEQLAGSLANAIAHHQAAEAMRESESRFRQMAETIESVFWMSSADLKQILYVSPAYERIWGRTCDSLYHDPKSFVEAVHEEDRGRVIANLERSHFSAGKEFQIEYRIVRPDGAVRWIRDRGFPVRDEAGRLLRMVGIAEDATERKQAEAALEASEHRYRALFDAGNDALFLGEITPEGMPGRFVEVNELACQRLGYEREELLRKSALDIDPCLNAERIRSVGNQLRTRGDMLIQTEHATKDGRRIPVEVSGRLFEWEVRQMVLTIARKRLETQLRQAQKMEAIGQLAGGVAHDFNNILAATMLNLELLQTDTTLSAATRETLKELMVQAERAAGLTRQLLLFGRRSVMQVRALDVNEVIENLLKMLRRLIGEHINLDWRGKSQLPHVMADAGMLEQVVMNLVVNARDAMPKGGQLTLTTEALELQAEQIPANSTASPGRFVCLSVSDSGCGMDETVLKRIFEPFFTTKEPGKGTGLGLATVYGIVSQHRGCIVVESQAGQGSTFRVFLPVADKPISGGPSGQKRRVARGGSETILLVEDDVAVRTTTRAILRSWGYNVLEAENGVEALDVWRSRQQGVDLLLTDMVMPAGVSGLELAERLRAAKPELKVIISSGYSSELVRQGAAALEGIRYAPKPCPPAELAAAIRQCLDKPSAAGGD
jgi:PAS domain S-box-containing protein